jgi:hypothetical protein
MSSKVCLGEEEQNDLRKRFILEKVVKEEVTPEEEVIFVNHSPIIKSHGNGMHQLLSISFNISVIFRSFST